MPVQVLRERVDAKVAERDAIGIDHGHDLEDEAAAQRGGAGVAAAQEEEEHAVEEVARGRLPGVHARRDEDDTLS